MKLLKKQVSIKNKKECCLLFQNSKQNQPEKTTSNLSIICLVDKNYLNQHSA